MKKTFYIAPSSIAYNLRDNCMRCNWIDAHVYVPGFVGGNRPGRDFTVYNAVDAFFKSASPIEWLKFQGIPVQSIVRATKLRGTIETDLCIYSVTGTPDMVMLLEDGTFGIIELKCAKPTVDAVRDYLPQVACYKRMDPRITRTWMLFFDMQGFLSVPEGMLNGKWTLTEVDAKDIDLEATCDRLGRFFVMDIPPMDFHCDQCERRLATAEFIQRALGKGDSK